MNIKDYGYIPKEGQEDIGVIARITACHKNKFEFVCDYGDVLLAKAINGMDRE